MSPKNSCLVKKKKKRKTKQLSQPKKSNKKRKNKRQHSGKRKKEKEKKKEKVIGQSGYGHFYPLNSPIFFLEFFLYFGKKTF